MSVAAKTKDLKTAPARPPLKGVQFLLPIWGSSYIRQFLELSLPTWLAPGNIPGVAKAISSEIVMLTSADGEATMRRHPAIRRLEAIVPVRYLQIDHLITGNNHSTTITLAYAEGVRAMGHKALDTCFFFLVSDYLVARGSFISAFRRIVNGADGVLTGNFQVTEEEAKPWLRRQLRGSPEVLDLDPRTMARWGLAYLHPVTISNVINCPGIHNTACNRLFWRVDDDTIVGRFYLMHMLCIRPETIDFEIGSSCDYSFIPELCPSDRIEIVDDSDEYLVIEMQPQSHEITHLMLGDQNIDELALLLSQWTTARHRKNAATNVVFHADDIPKELQEVAVQAEDYIGRVAERLSPEPMSHRDHPYWRGAIATWREATGKPLTNFEWRVMMGLSQPMARQDSLSEWIKERIIRLVGRPPNVKSWHPRASDYELLRSALREREAPDAKRLLISDTSTAFSATLTPRERTVRVRAHVMLQRSPESLANLGTNFDLCLIELVNWNASSARDLLRRVAPLMKADGVLLFSCMSSAGLNPADIASLQSTIKWRVKEGVEVLYVPTSKSRVRMLHRLRPLASFSRRRPFIGIPLLGLIAPFLIAATWLERVSSKPVAEYPPNGYISSVLVIFQAAAVRQSVKTETASEPPRGETNDDDDELQFAHQKA